MRCVLSPFLVLIALIFLVEAWLWEHLRPLVGWIVDLIAWKKLKARLASAIERLPPYPTLLIFLIPPIILFPFKLLGLWMLAHGSWLGATVVLVLAKLVGTGVAAFIFDVTRPKLLQIGWFRRLYGFVLALLERAHALIDPIKLRIKRAARRYVWLFKPGRPSRFFRRIARIRRRVQAQPAE